MSDAIVLDDLTFALPDGQVMFDRLSSAVGPGRIGLIGANGCGKSTLLRLIAGELTPARGSVQVAGSLGYLRQDLTLAADLAVEEVLGSARARRALRAIERGRAAAEHCAAVGDHWDVDERARATLDRLGLAHLGLDRRVGELSGGGSVTQARSPTARSTRAGEEPARMVGARLHQHHLGAVGRKVVAAAHDLGLDEPDPLTQDPLQRDAYRVGGARARRHPGAAR